MQNQQQQQQQQMSCGGGVGVGGGGLSRFRSAPATWFDNLLQVQEDEEPQNQNLPQLPNLRNSASYDPTTLFESTNFARHNSSPPELLAHLTSSSTTLPSDGYFSSSDYDLLSILDIPTTSKRSRESESTIQSKIEHSSDFSNMEMDNLFPDSVPCRVRAKRGCATHPRSIAERVRRTRISDRIRKLQELVPNMDKQTNTADMLDEAVEYVKYLQKQIQELSEHQKNCTCISRD